MDGTEDDARYPPNPSGEPYGYGVNHNQGYGYYLNNQRSPVRNCPYSEQVANEYAEDNNEKEVEDDEEQIGEEEDDDNNNDGHGDVDQSNNLHHSLDDIDHNDNVEGSEDEDGDGDENDGNNEVDDEDDGDDIDTKQKSYVVSSDGDLERHPRKQKLKSLISAYEFAPRVPAPTAVAPSAPKPSGGRNSLTDWTEHETFVLLDTWGDRFLQHGRKSLRSEEWQEVAEKVSEVSKIERTDTQCRNRVDTLKKKYKKEKTKLEEMGGGINKWVYFKRMDKLMSSMPQQAGLSCGLDSGEYVFMNSRVYLNRANGLDEMRGSPGNSVSNGEEGSAGCQPKKKRYQRDRDGASSFRMLADSIQKFSDIYEKIENSKRQQMLELEKMRMDFHKDLEAQQRQILQRMQAEISKLQERD